MKTNRTFTMLKPDSIEDGYMLPILNKISDSGFKIVALKYKKMNREEAEEFYSVHSEKPFFKDLIIDFEIVYKVTADNSVKEERWKISVDFNGTTPRLEMRSSGNTLLQIFQTMTSVMWLLDTG